MIKAVKVLGDQSFRFSATPRIVAQKALLSVSFSSQESWNGQPFPSPGDLPDSRVKPGSLILPVNSFWELSIN